MTRQHAPSFDVVVVGGRVAGSSLGARLAAAGLAVAVVEREPVLGDTLSTHVVQDLDLLRELGALEPVLASGAPPLTATRLTVDGVDLSAAHPRRPRLCVRRAVLDGALSAAADRAGATLLGGTAVVGLVRDGVRVVGARVERADGTRHELRSALVVGADGRNSTVARLVGAARYEVAPNERTAHWQYYAGVAMPPEFHVSRRGRDLALAAPCDGGLTLVAAQPPVDDVRDWRVPALLAATVEDLIGPLRGVLAHARTVGPVRSVRRMDGFFRESAGPGWALLGDAGHFKDVVVGQGISDAMRQARSLAEVVPSALDDPDRLDAALAAWWAARDADARPMSWFAQDFGRAETGVLDLEVLRVVARSRRSRRHLHEVLEHRRDPRTVVGPAVTSRAVAAATLRPDVPGPRVRAAVTVAVSRELERRRAARVPRAAASCGTGRPLPVTGGTAPGPGSSQGGAGGGR